MEETRELVARKISFKEREDFHTFYYESVTPERITHGLQIQLSILFLSTSIMLSSTMTLAVEATIMSHLDVCSTLLSLKEVFPSWIHANWDQFISRETHLSPWERYMFFSHYTRPTWLQWTIKSLYNFTSSCWSNFVLFFSTALSVITSSHHCLVFWMCQVWLFYCSGNLIFPELRQKYASHPDFYIFKLLLTPPGSPEVPEQNCLRKCTVVEE